MKVSANNKNYKQKKIRIDVKELIVKKRNDS